MTSKPRFKYIIFGLPPLLYLIGTFLVFPFQIDDSYISLRYARNLATGFGIVFNPNGPRTEGYTNFLLILIEAVLIRLGFDDLIPIKLFMIGCGLSTLYIIVWYGRCILVNSNNVYYWTPTVAALLVATSSPVILWAVSGMETQLFLFLLCSRIISYLLYLHGYLTGLKVLLIDLMLVLATFTRPEGLLFWVITTVHTLLVGFLKSNGATSRILTRLRVAGILFGLVSLTLYIIWKLIYFGQILPATYIAKAAPLSLITFIKGG